MLDLVKPINTNYFRKRAPQVVGWLVIGLFVLTTVFADFLTPYDYREQSRGEPSAPPTGLYSRDEHGNPSLRPRVYARRLTDPLRLQYSEDTSRSFPLSFFVRG